MFPDNPFDSIIVGYYQDGKLQCAAKVRNGFVPHTRKEVSTPTVQRSQPLQPNMTGARRELSFAQADASTQLWDQTHPRADLQLQRSGRRARSQAVQRLD